jgi:glutamine synthetase
MDEQQVLNLLESKGIEHLWVIWHDLSGRSCTKTVSRERFPGVFKSGVVFAKADMDFNLEDHMAPGSRFTAETGDFLAIPDPTTFGVIPYHPATGRMYAFLRADDSSAWEGCPRTQLQKIVEAYASEGMSVRVAFESEFTLFSPGDDGEYLPADTDGMFTVAGLDRHFPLWQNLMNTVRDMGVQMEQMGKEYGPGQC